MVIMHKITDWLHICKNMTLFHKKCSIAVEFLMMHSYWFHQFSNDNIINIEIWREFHLGHISEIFINIYVLETGHR